MSTRETILTALHARLLALPATVLRGEVLPERVPSDGLVILRDGDPGDPEVTMSPLAYHYRHKVELEVVVQGVNRDMAFDDLCMSIGSVLAAAPTLDGLIDWMEVQAPQTVDLPVDGAISLKASELPIILHYVSRDPLA